MVKVCSKCGIEKEVSEFYKDKKGKDGLRAYCKNCKLAQNKEFTNTEDGALWYKNYLKSYRKTEKCKNSIKKYNDNRKANETEQLKNKARKKLTAAIKSGELIKPDRCQICSSMENIEAHHHSYEEGFELDVIFICRDRCHKIIHKTIRDLEES